MASPRIVRHVGLPLDFVSRLVEREFAVASARHNVELRPWLGRRDFDMLLVANRTPLSDLAQHVARWFLRPEYVVGGRILEAWKQPKRFAEDCAGIAAECSMRRALPDLRLGLSLVERLTEPVVHAGKRWRLLTPDTGETGVWLHVNGWYCSAIPPLQLAGLAHRVWHSETRDPAPGELASATWASVESLVLLVLLRHRDRMPALPESLPVECVRTPDVLPALSQSRTVGFFTSLAGVSTVAACQQHRPDLDPGMVSALLAAGAALGAVRSPAVLGHVSGTVQRSRPAVSAAMRQLPWAVQALARLLRLAPVTGGTSSPSTRPVAPAPTQQDKFVICGDFASGKTTALLSLAGTTALTMEVATSAAAERAVKASTTVGFDHAVMTVEGRPIFLYAAPGQPRFRLLAESLLHGCHGVLLLVNGESRHAIENTRSWLATIELSAPTAPVVIALNRVCPETPPLAAFHEAALLHHVRLAAVVTADPRKAGEMLACLRLLVSALLSTETSASAMLGGHGVT